MLWPIVLKMKPNLINFKIFSLQILQWLKEHSKQPYGTKYLVKTYHNISTYQYSNADIQKGKTKPGTTTQPISFECSQALI